MIGLIAGVLIFGLTTIILTKETRALWSLDATAVLAAPGNGSKPGLSRRLRIASPSALVLSVSLLALSIVAFLDDAGFTIPRYAFAGSLALLAISLTLVVLAVVFGVPRIALLPAFRAGDAYQRAVSRL
jgi:hypothetical protein